MVARPTGKHRNESPLGRYNGR